MIMKHQYYGSKAVFSVTNIYLIHAGNVAQK